MIRKMMMAALAAMGLSLQAATNKDINGVPYSSTGDIVLGEFTSQWSKAKKYAEDKKVPIVALMVKTGCGNCAALEESIAGAIKSGGAFKTWMESGLGSKVVLVVSVDGLTESCLGFFGAEGTYPFIGVYWPGHSVKKWTSLSSSLSQSKFRSTAESWLKDYSANNGGKFALEKETTGNRYEIEAGSDVNTVTVEFVRDKSAASQAATDTFDVDKGCTASASKIAWKAGETAKTVTVTLPKTLAAGTTVTMTLNKGKGESKGEASRKIAVVKAGNSASNPDWGFKALGEWTMDIDTAMTKGDYTLVSIQGSQWCPDCANTDRNFLEADGSGAKFKAWAKGKQIALVSLDIPNFNGPKATDFASPCLLSRTAAESTLARAGEYPQSGAPESLTKPLLRSGLGYQTRKGITADQAKTRLNRFHDLASLNTDKNGFHRPEDGNANRTGVPIFVLLRKDGTVAARFTDFASTSPMSDDKANYDSYIKRLEEMLAIADGTSADDKSEIWNNRACGKSPVLLANGGSQTARLCKADLIDSFRLDKFEGKGEVSVTLKPAGGPKPGVEISFWTVNEKGEAEMLKSSSKTVKAGWSSATHSFKFADSGTYYVQVKATDTLTAAAKAENFAAYTITSALVLIPGEARAESAAPSGSDTVSMELAKGTLYRIEGLKAGANDSKLKPSGDYLYTAQVGGAQTLTCASAGGKVVYQIWKPGKVGFEPGYVSTPVKKTTKKDVTITRKEDESVEVGFRRTTGISGDVRIKVSLDLAKTDFYYDWAWNHQTKDEPRFTIDGSTSVNTWSKTVDWKDGKALKDCVGSIRIAPADEKRTGIYYGNGKVVLKLEIVSQTASGKPNKVDNGVFTINFTDNQKASAGKVAILGADRPWAKAKTVYARKSDTVKVRVGRLEAMDGDVQAKLKSSVSSVKFGGDYDAKDLLTWINHDGSVKTVEVSGLQKDKTAKLTLSAVTKGLKTLSSSNTVSIVTVADDAPAFEQESFARATVYRYVASTNLYKVTGTTGKDVSFTKISGSLPAGLSVKWDNASKSMMVCGVPTGDVKTGKDYTALYQVSEKRPKSKGSKTKVTVKGLVASVSFRAVDPTAKGSGSGGAAINAACNTSRTFKDLMVLGERTDGEGLELVGTLQLTLPKTGKASAKLLCADGTVSFSAKNWSGLDLATGDLRCTLAPTSKKYAGWTVEVTAGRDKSIAVVVAFEGVAYVAIENDGTLWSSKHQAKDCAGYYTVTFADNVVGEYPDITGAGADRATTGSAYLTLKMSTTAQYNAGTMTWAGVLPNGTSVSGSSTLTEVSKSLVNLPFLKSVSGGKDVFSGVLEITRGAKAKKEGKGCWETVREATVDEAPVLSRWAHTEKSSKTKLGDYDAWMRPYGGIYDVSTLGLDCCCADKETGRGTVEMTLAAFLPDYASDYYRDFDAIEPIDVKVTKTGITRLDSKGGKNKISLSFSKSTGVVSGTFKVFCKDAKGKAQTLSATYKGVVQLGFGDGCGCHTGSEAVKPFVNGFWYFTDKLGYKSGKTTQYLSVKRGGELVIDSFKVD